MHFSSKAKKGRRAIWSAGGLAVFCALALGCIGGGPETNGSCKEPELRITAGKLADIFRRNEDKAYEYWRGRTVVVEGAVSLVESDDEPYVELAAYGIPGIRCVLGKEDAAEAAKLASGQHAAVAGTVLGFDVDKAVLLRPCRIVDAAAAARIPEQPKASVLLPAPEAHGDAAEFIQDCKAAKGAMTERYVSVSGPVVKAEEIGGVCHTVLDGGVHCAMRDKVECVPGAEVILAGTVESCDADAAKLKDCTIIGSLLGPGR